METPDQVRGPLKCVCGKEFEVVTPRRIVTNTNEYSLAFFPHERAVTCPHCQRTYQPGIIGFSVEWAWQEVKTKSVIVVPGLVKPN